MGKRLLVGVLWFYAGWYLGASASVLLVVHPGVGPLMGLAAASFFAGDPFRLIWSRRRSDADRRQRQDAVAELA